MDDATLEIFVNKAVRAMQTVRPAERWSYLIRLRARLFADLRARRLDRDLATVQADLAVEAVLEALVEDAGRRPITFGSATVSPIHPGAVSAALSP